MVNYFKGKEYLLIAVVFYSLVSAFFLWQSSTVSEPPVRVNTDARWITTPIRTNLCYFKKDFYIDSDIKQGWLLFQAFDSVTIYINGKFVVSQKMQGAMAKKIMDISNFMVIGHNIIIIEASNSVFDSNPEVLIEIGYLDFNNKDHLFLTDNSWDVNVYNYDKRNLDMEAGTTYWQKAGVIDRASSFLSSVDRDIFSFPISHCFVFDHDTRFSLFLRDKSDYAWLRFASTGNYKVYVNNKIIAQEEFISPFNPTDIKEIGVYRIDRFLRTGANEIKLIFSPSDIGKIGVYLDAVAYSGGRVIATGDSINSYQKAIPVQCGEGGVKTRYTEDIPYTLPEILRYIFIFLIILFISAIISLFFRDDSSALAYLLISSALLIFLISLNYDERLSYGYTYRLSFFLLSVIIPLAVIKIPPLRDNLNPFKLTYDRVIISIVTLSGFLIRVVYFNMESFHPDEASLILKAQGVLDNLYPSLKLTDNIPTWYITTSELLSYLQALFIEVVGANELAIRLPGLLAGTFSIILVYMLTNLISTKRVALLSAAVYAFLPTTIGMTGFGRYPSLLLMTVLCSVYFLHKYFKGEENKYLLLSALFFLLSYFSWQGSAFFIIAIIFNIIYFRRSKSIRDLFIYLSIVSPVIFLHLLFRFYLISTVDIIYYGNGTASITPVIAFFKPYFYPFYYFKYLLLVDSHLFLSLVFFTSLGIQCYYFLKRQPFSGALLFMQVYLLVTTFCMTFFLEIYSYRYVYYLIPYLIIGSCITLDIISKACMKFMNRSFLVFSLILFLLSTDFVIKTGSLPYTTTALKSHYDVIYFSQISDIIPSLKYYISTDDIVLSMQPHLLRVYKVKEDLYFQTKLLLPIVTEPLDASPLHRVTGDKSVLSIEELLKIQGTGHKIWIVMAPLSIESVNPRDIAFIKNNFKIFYEDINAQIYVSGNLM